VVGGSVLTVVPVEGCEEELETLLNEIVDQAASNGYGCGCDDDSNETSEVLQ